jgi:hypothetical protein
MEILIAGAGKVKPGGIDKEIKIPALSPAK